MNPLHSLKEMYWANWLHNLASTARGEPFTDADWDTICTRWLNNPLWIEMIGSKLGPHATRASSDTPEVEDDTPSHQTSQPDAISSAIDAPKVVDSEHVAPPSNDSHSRSSSVDSEGPNIFAYAHLAPVRRPLRPYGNMFDLERSIARSEKRWR